MAQLNNHLSCWWKEMVRTNNDELTLGAFVITFAIVILGILWYKKTIWSPTKGALSLPPGPISLTIVGYLSFLSPDLHRQFTDMAQTYGPIFKIYLGSKLYIVISNPELAKVVFRDQDENFSNRKFGTRSFRRNEVRKTTKNVFAKIGGNSSLEGAKLHMAVSKIFELMGKPNVSDFIPSLAWLDLQVRHGRKKDLLQILLELNDQKEATSLSITQIKALLMDTMVAGTDTTTLIEWAMTEILKNHSIMRRIQEELENVVGVNNMVEESHLPQLIYLDATIKETFRLHPVVPLGLPRSPNQTCTVGGYTIPKGCTVFINVWAIQRDPRYWDKPLEFKPERFLSIEGTNKWDFTGNNMKFLPFGSGRRLCPGYPLAEKMQMC
ncbi:cytochrome P450 [Tanacetum coccineum]